MIKLPTQKTKEILVGSGVIDGANFDQLATEAERKKQHLLDLLVSKNVITEDYFYDLVSKKLNIPRVSLQAVSINRDALNLLPEDVARQKNAVVLKTKEDGSFDVAMENPMDLETVNFLKLRLKGQINPYLASDKDLEQAYSLYGEQQTSDFKEIIEDKVKESLRSKAKGLEEAAMDLPVVALVDNLFAYAYSLRSSDIHIEALEEEVLFRFRIDGILREILRVPKDILPAIVARVKILGGLRIDEHGKPQDGRFRQNIGDKALDIRLSVLPTFYGEKAVMRLLESSQKPLSFQELGMLDDMAKIITEATSKSYGMVLVCGPTGSGKTTTLYSILSRLNDPRVNIITVENPIEYNMRYINQVQVNEVIGINFANGLRSILRQDPDIIMVGEIRDNETADISVQAALTGHLVLSTLHTNDAPTAIPRLIDLGVKPFLVAAVINAVLSQRLVRKIHSGCIESYEPGESVHQIIREQLEAEGIDSSKIKLPERMYRGRGCDQCHGTGYVGRVGIFEVLFINEAIKNLITGPNLTLDNLFKIAKKSGMITMFEDGIRKVERGVTTIDEVFRVIRE